MELQILSDYPLVDDFWQVLVQTCKKYPAITGIHEIGDSDTVSQDKPLLVLGKPERAKGLTATTVMPLSVKSILGTSGGGTKLDHAIRLIAEPTASATRTVLSTPPRWSDQLMAVDIEVSGDIQTDEPEDTEMLSISVASYAVLNSEIETYAYGLDELTNPHTRADLQTLLSENHTILHNGKFDCRWISPWIGQTIYPDDDTMLMHACLYPAAGENGLKDLAKRMFNAPDWETDLKKYTRGKAHFERIPQDILKDYNQWDVYWTLRLYARLISEMIQNKNASDLYYDHVLPASHMLQDVEQYGMPVDMSYANELSGQLEQSIHDIKERLLDITENDTFNPASPLQVKKFLRECGYGVGSTDEKSLTNLLMYHHPTEGVQQFVKDLLEYRGLTKINGTYITGISKKVRNSRVHPTFLLHGTSTGRLSSRGPNAQNLPNDEEGKPSVKRMFQPDLKKNMSIISCDYAQAELRTMAELSDDELMIADLQEDSPDFFDNMMPDVFPIEYDPYNPNKVLFDITTLDKEHRKPYRLRLKRVIYGSSYGLGANACAAMLTLEGTPTTVSEAIAIQNGYLGRYAGLRAWRESILPRVLRGDDLITPFGRRFQQDTVTAGYLSRVQNQAWAFPPQSIATDICVRAAIKLHPEIKAMGGSIIALVHDAIDSEVPDERATECGELMALRMREAATTVFHRVPFLTEWKIGKNLAEV